MANAKKCDRCGAYYQDREMTAIESIAEVISAACKPQAERKCITGIEKFLDLCPCCSKSLKQWVKGDKAEDGK